MNCGPAAAHLLRLMAGAAPILALLTITGAAAAEAACSADAVDLRWDGGAAHFNVEIADTPDTRAQGLMHRETLPRSAGMLFVYDRPTSASFWMRNTLIPLDILFFDDSGTLTVAQTNARPLDETPLPGGDGVKLVLEINGGLARRIGLGPGAQIRHPALDPGQAAWPCE